MTIELERLTEAKLEVKNNLDKVDNSERSLDQQRHFICGQIDETISKILNLAPGSLRNKLAEITKVLPTLVDFPAEGKQSFRKKTQPLPESYSKPAWDCVRGEYSTFLSDWQKGTTLDTLLKLEAHLTAECPMFAAEIRGLAERFTYEHDPRLGIMGLALSKDVVAIKARDKGAEGLRWAALEIAAATVETHLGAKIALFEECLRAQLVIWETKVLEQIEARYRLQFHSLQIFRGIYQQVNDSFNR